MIWLVLLIVVPVLLILLNRQTWILSYWEFKGVSGPKPTLFFGNMLQNFLGIKSHGELCLELVKKFNDKPIIGMYNFMSPTLLIPNVDYVETVLIKEFSHFVDRAVPNLYIPPSDETLFFLSATKWKALRTKLSPVFTSGKLKGMVRTMNDCFKRTSDIIDSKQSRQIQTNEFVHTYTIDVIAKVAFGIESAELSNPQSEFTMMMKKLFCYNWKRFLEFIIFTSFPKIAATFNIAFIPQSLINYFHNIVKETLKLRQTSPVKTNDFIELLLELKQKGHIDVATWDEEDDYLKTTESNRTVETIELTDDLLVAQATVFLTTGFDSMSTSLTYTLLEISQNRQVMDKLVNEVDRVYEEHKDFTYDALNDMKYLDMCFLEAMRLHPGVEVINRCCTKNYTFDNGMQIEKGTMVSIPVLAIHMDPNNYPDPMKFDPERFSTPPRPAAYLAFGAGPKICIAKRFAMLQMKVMLAKLLHSYQVRLDSKTKLPVKTYKWNFLTTPSSPVYFNLTKRDHSM